MILYDKNIVNPGRFLVAFRQDHRSTKQSCFVSSLLNINVIPAKTGILDSRLRGNDNSQLLRRLTPPRNDSWILKNLLGLVLQL
ncbi:hypothetical protein [Candidatus Tisiphia endosymbiont of Hybos culiciformis]|uniref:hypothetical protein n=1 Tax=Candidatus Tisiphia endosymbiont of Hybos culiciformis TaxID=3139331 RepID=UPI003CCAB914